MDIMRTDSFYYSPSLSGIPIKYYPKILLELYTMSPEIEILEALGQHLQPPL